MSDKFTIKLIKRYVESKSFVVVRANSLEDLKSELAAEGQKRCIFFDENYERVLREFVSVYAAKERQLLLVYLKCNKALYYTHRACSEIEGAEIKQQSVEVDEP